jgi:transposase
LSTATYLNLSHKSDENQFYLEKATALPSDSELMEMVGPDMQAPKQASTVEPYRETIQGWLKQGVEMTAIWLRLQENYGYTGGYSSVRRFVHRLDPIEPEVFIRVHSEPGEDMQVDFGTVGQLYDPVTKRLRTAYVFVATLGYSRHQYAELVFDQKIATWISLHKRTFEYFGGVPQRVIPDNLKAAVLQAAVHDPILGDAYRRMALHYGFLISPTIPHTPRHKGKVESGVHYVKRNFFAGQEFVDIHVANLHLRDWIMNTAGVRKHGTTSEAPLHLFRETEKACLQLLPVQPFQLMDIHIVIIHPDCHVVISKSYYSVPFGYVGQELAAHVSENFIEIYDGQKLVTTHPRSTRAGQWSTRMEDYPPAKAAYLIRTPLYCKKLATKIGPSTQNVVEQLLADRPLDRLRSVQAILKLEESVGSKRLEAACARAAHFGDIRYRQIKLILNAALDCEPLPEVQLARAALSHTFARRGEEFFGVGS